MPVLAVLAICPKTEHFKIVNVTLPPTRAEAGNRSVRMSFTLLLWRLRRRVKVHRLKVEGDIVLFYILISSPKTRSFHVR